MKATPHYNSISNFFLDEATTPLLERLIVESATPLCEIEDEFAIDATGFSTSVYDPWYDHRYGRERRKQRWLKAHATVGVRTKIVTSLIVTESKVHDGQMLVPSLERTAENFTIKDVMADKAYLSRENVAQIAKMGARPVIKMKENSRGHGHRAWQRLWAFFHLNREDFLNVYHQRSNVESVFSAVKRKLDVRVRSKHEVAMRNEILAKFLMYNLTVLCRAIHTFAIEPTFWTPTPAPQIGQ